MSVRSNLIHASDSLETAEEEIRRFFSKDELFDYSPLLEGIVYSAHERG
jgi:nucleoside-diphosphate kinase